MYIYFIFILYSFYEKFIFNNIPIYLKSNNKNNHKAYLISLYNNQF